MRFGRSAGNGSTIEAKNSAGAAEQSRALAALGPERSAQLADLLRELLLATER